MLLGENSDYIEDLFGAAVQYQVPRYQRRYVWDIANWSTLWEDILSQLNLRLIETLDGGSTSNQREQPESTLSAGPEDDNKAHFTGLIVTRPISRGKLSRFEVIDGQQRLATFQIVLSVIRDICESKGHSELASEVDGHIVNTTTVVRRNISKIFPDPTYKFQTTAYDESAFRAVVEGKYGKVIPEAFDEATNLLQPELIDQARSKVFANLKDMSDNILDAYDYFYERIRIYVGEICDYSRVDNLVSSIKSGFNLIHITLGSSDQSEEIFESLNATGRKLSEFDYLRNHLFLRAGKLGVDKDIGGFCSDNFYDQYWHFENAAHYWNADRLESFLRAFLIAKLGPENEEDALKSFDRYKNYSKTLTEEQRQSVKYEFEQLKFYADSYQEMSDPASEIGKRMQFYDDLCLTRLDPFMLFLKHSLGLKSNELIDFCKVLESYIVRQVLCYGSWESCYRKINALFAEAMESRKFDINNFKESVRCPNDEEVRTALKGAGFKDDRLICYILYRIEDEEKKKSLEFNSLHLLSIEHRVLPESRDSSGVIWWIEPENIGNITLRTSDLPSDWSNLSFPEKKKVLNRDVAPGLYLTDKVCSFDTWTAGDIEKRAGDLLTDFTKIWREF